MKKTVLLNQYIGILFLGILLLLSENVLQDLKQKRKNRFL